MRNPGDGNTAAMTGFFQQLKGGGQPGTSSAEPKLTLAGFGKHPGWDDHILDRQRDLGLGPETDVLEQVKQALYVGGIGGQIDSGAWEKLEPVKRIAGFEHTFLWFRSRHVILGRFWSSTDGKGRAKYPMVLCVDSEAVAPGFLMGSVLPGLERLRECCKATTSAEQVKRDCRAAQEQLQGLLSAGGSRETEVVPALELRRRFLDRADLGPEHLGFLRLLHELASSPALAGGGRAPAPGPSATQRSSHLRLPLAAESRNDALLLWAAFLRCAVPEAVPLLLLARPEAGWVDVVIGEPVSDDFFCLQASPKALPLATEIPYQLPPELKQRLLELTAAFLGAGPTGVVAQVSAQQAPPSKLAPAPSPSTKQRNLKLPLLGGVGVLAVLAVVAAVLLSGRRHATSPPAGARNPAAVAAQKSQPSAVAQGKAAEPQTGQSVAVAQAERERKIPRSHQLCPARPPTKELFGSRQPGGCGIGHQIRRPCGPQTQFRGTAGSSFGRSSGRKGTAV